MNVIVADDEAPARRALVRMLDTLGVTVLAQAETGLATLEAVGRARPDVLLLDIHMPEMDGIALARAYADLPPIVFVTADDSQALRAFEVGAFDYLLKPVSRDRLAEALAKALKRAEGGARVEVGSMTTGSTRVITHTRGTIRFFDASRIDRFRAQDKYTVFTCDGEEHLTEEPISALEARLGLHGFVRAHRAELVRARAVTALTNDPDGHHAHLVSGEVVDVSRRLVAAFKAALGA